MTVNSSTGVRTADVPRKSKANCFSARSFHRPVSCMPKSHFRRKLAASSSLLRFIFPQTRARAHIRLSRFRHETVPSLRNRAKSQIYKYILYRQALKLKGRQGIFQRLQGHARQITGRHYLENEARPQPGTVAKGEVSKETNKQGMSYQDSYAPREPGQRRKKLAGYLKAANELRQTYTQHYAPNWSNRETQYDYEDDTPGDFPDAAVVRSGEEEMILFPSYARKHVKRKPEAEPGSIQEVDGEGRDVRDSTGAGDAEFWKKQWDNYEDDNAVVDVDVRGWIYSPHKGQMSRKQRLFIGLARQLVGVSALAASSTSATSNRDASPQRHGFRERAHLRTVQYDEELAAREAEQILRKGEEEAATAAKGKYSESPSKGNEDDMQLYRTESTTSARTAGSYKDHQLSHSASKTSLNSEDNIKPVQKRVSWQQPADMSPAELAEANTRLMARLRHFLAAPMSNTPISIFFYNDTISKQRTVYTDLSGHFSVSAALDFIPTHARILASDKLSMTEEVTITESTGISVISDIDDTIKHSAISSGAREIFRNAFIRDLGDLTIEGVKEWYNSMADLGVKFHYVSNSPWQLFPIISKYFSLAGLPPGSFHLKQYSGMLQGIFEPVAERKKVTLDKIARDFPERNFILVGDSGEADLEVYTDFVLENPGRIKAIFIRDVTTSQGPDFFDPSTGFASSDERVTSSTSSQQNGSRVAGASDRLRASSEEDDTELNAAIAASLRDLEEHEQRRSRSIFPQMDSNHPHLRPKLPDRPASQRASTPARQESTPNLIDLSPDDEVDNRPALRRVNTDSMAEPMSSATSTKPAPPPPKKPVALRSSSNELTSSTSSSTSTSRPSPPPPRPRGPSTTVNQPSPLSQQISKAGSIDPSTLPVPPMASKPNLNHQGTSQSQDGQTYAGMARDKLWSVYSNLPALRPQEATSDSASVTSFTSETENLRKGPPPPPPRRGGNRGAAANAASYVGSKASAAWQHAPSIPYATRPQIHSANTAQPFSSTTRQSLNRTNTGSTLGTNTGDGQYINKREQLWQQRWAKAEDLMVEKGVVLRSWRIGTDVIKEAERVIKNAEKAQTDKDENRGGTSNTRKE